jgi:hypothetical protein
MLNFNRDLYASACPQFWVYCPVYKDDDETKLVFEKNSATYTSSVG